MTNDQDAAVFARAMSAYEHLRERHHWAMAALAAIDTTGHPDGLGALLERAGLSRLEADELLAELERAFPDAQRRWDWMLKEQLDRFGGSTPYTAVGEGRLSEVLEVVAEQR
jgi:hypothetical protein